jgi:streptogramin lyase
MTIPSTSLGARPSTLIVALALVAATTTALAQSDLPTNNVSNPYRTVANYFTLTDGRAWGSTSAVEIDRDGRSIWVAERCGTNSCAGSNLPSILKFDASGRLVKSFGEGVLLFPHGIFVDRDGNVWVTDGQDDAPRAQGTAANTLPGPPPGATRGNQVFKFSPDGKLLMTLGTRGGAAAPGFFYQPNDVLVAPNGTIFVSEGHGGANARILKFSKDGRLLKTWGTRGSGDGQLDGPHALAMDSRGRLFVGDRSNNRIVIFDQEGRQLAVWRQFSRPSGIYIDKRDVIYVADSESESVSRNHDGWKRGIRIGSARDGSVTAFIPDPVDKATGTSAAEGVAADADGNIFGAEVGPKGVKKYVRAAAGTVTAQAIPRTADGKPDLQGIWQARSRAAYDLEDHPARFGMPAGRSVVDTGTIPYQPSAIAKRKENYEQRATADPLAQCFLPGVPRLMYMEYPFQIFQTRESVAITFEWQQVFRLIYTNGTTPSTPLEFWMGDSRGRWDGDTLVVDVTNHNDRTWFDMAGNFHGNALHVIERFTLVDPDTIRYQATIDDPKTFTRPWTITVPLVRQKDMPRLLEYQCRAEMEEARGDFKPEPRTWYRPGAPPVPAFPPQPRAATTVTPKGPLPRTADGKPDISGFVEADAGGANWGFEPHNEPFTPGGRGVLVDPKTGGMPYQPWARQEKENRVTPERGYDDPTAHCFAGGVPRSLYVPSPFYIVQTPGYVVILLERMSWRIVPLDGRAHLPDTIRLWQGDSLGRWDGETLVVETTNLNGKTWLNEVGDVISHAATVVERFTPVSADLMQYEATVSDPIVFTRPWTTAMPMKRNRSGELLEVACLEDNQDLGHLKDVRDGNTR